MHRATSLLLGCVAFPLLVAGASRTLAQTYDIETVPGLDARERLAVSPVPHGWVNTIGGNLQIRTPGLTAGSLLGPVSMGAVYNSADHAWRFSWQTAFDNAQFLDADGTVYPAVDAGGAALTPAEDAVISGTPLVYRSASQLMTKGGQIRDFDPANGGRIERAYWISSLKNSGACGAQALVPSLEYGYDAQGRLEAVEQCGSTSCVPLFSVSHDANGRVDKITRWFDPAEGGLQLPAADANPSLTFEYDAQDRIAAVRTSWDVQEGKPGVRFAYQGEELTSVTDTEGLETTYAYAAPGRVSRVTSLGENNPVLTFTYEAQPLGVYRTLVYANGGELRLAYRYDAQRRPTNVENLTVSWRRAFTWTPERLLASAETIKGATHVVGTRLDFSYNEREDLSRVESSTDVVEISYPYEEWDGFIYGVEYAENRSDPMLAAPLRITRNGTVVESRDFDFHERLVGTYTGDLYDPTAQDAMSSTTYTYFDELSASDAARAPADVSECDFFPVDGSFNAPLHNQVVKRASANGGRPNYQDFSAPTGQLSGNAVVSGDYVSFAGGSVTFDVGARWDLAGEYNLWVFGSKGPGVGCSAVVDPTSAQWVLDLPTGPGWTRGTPTGQQVASQLDAHLTITCGNWANVKTVVLTNQDSFIPVNSFGEGIRNLRQTWTWRYKADGWTDEGIVAEHDFLPAIQDLDEFQGVNVEEPQTKTRPIAFGLVAPVAIGGTLAGSASRTQAGFLGRTFDGVTHLRQLELAPSFSGAPETITLDYRNGSQLAFVARSNAGGTAVSFDGLGRPSQIADDVDGGVEQTSFAYDTLGRIASIARDNGLEKQNGYNALVLLSSETYLRNGVVEQMARHKYYLNQMPSLYGLPKQVQDLDNHPLVIWAYDAAGRVNQVQYAGGERVIPTYDPVQGSQIVQEKFVGGNGQTLQIVSYSYDDRGRLVGIDHRKAAADPQTPLVRYRWGVHEMKQIEYGNGLSRHFSVDSDFGIDSARVATFFGTDPSLCEGPGPFGDIGCIELTEKAVFETEGDPNREEILGTILCLTGSCADGTNLHSSQEDYFLSAEQPHAYRLRGAKLTEFGPGAQGPLSPLQHDYFEYRYDAYGNLLELNRQANLDPPADGSPASFDPFPTEPGFTAWQYNAEKNRLQRARTLAGAAVGEQYDRQPVDYAYDAAGFTTLRGEQVIDWTANGMVHQVTDSGTGAVATLEWNALGQPVSRELGDRQYSYLFGGRVEKVVDSTTGEEHWWLDFGDAKVDIEPGGSSARIFRHFDTRGNVKFLTDDTGTVVTAYDYHAYGLEAVIGDGGVDRRRFARGWHLGDGADDLVLVGVRTYDPSTGRFLSQDPIAQLYNQYAYTPSDPVHLWDPTGLVGDFTALVPAGYFVVPAPDGALVGTQFVPPPPPPPAPPKKPGLLATVADDLVHPRTVADLFEGPDALFAVTAPITAGVVTIELGVLVAYGIGAFSIVACPVCGVAVVAIGALEVGLGLYILW